MTTAIHIEQNKIKGSLCCHCGKKCRGHVCLPCAILIEHGDLEVFDDLDSYVASRSY